MNEIKKSELIAASKYMGGEYKKDSTGWYIQIDTGDNTSKENYDDLISDSDELKKILNNWEIIEFWADHDTQIIELKEIK